MHYAFTDDKSVYIALDYMNGGDLRYQMSANRYFDEKQISRMVLTRIHCR